MSQSDSGVPGSSFSHTIGLAQDDGLAGAVAPAALMRPPTTIAAPHKATCRRNPASARTPVRADGLRAALSQKRQLMVFPPPSERSALRARRAGQQSGW